MNTPSMIVTPSTILLQPHVGRFHASDQEKVSPNFLQLLSEFDYQVGGIAVQHAGATIVYVWHCMSA